MTGKVQTTGPEIDIAIRCDRWESALDDAGALCRRAAIAALGVAQPIAGPAELGIMLTDDDGVARLNLEYRGTVGPTNVLAFPGDDGEAARALSRDAPTLLGDVVVAFETAAAEAEIQPTPLSDHLSHLIVHGVLHLLGHDHGDDRDAERMEALEVDALATLGVANPYEINPDAENEAFMA